jgi:hypothetical protein
MKLGSLLMVDALQSNTKIPLKNWGLHRLDLHGFQLIDAKYAIKKLIKIAIKNNENELFLIHGFHNGTVLKSYIRDGELTKDMLSAFSNLREIKIYPNENGSTYVKLFWNKPQDRKNNRGIPYVQ